MRRGDPTACGQAKRALLALAVVVLALTGCGEPAAEDVRVEEAPLRVVSLAPALTQMVVDLGQGGALVGVGKSDAAAPAGLPVVGTYQDISIERLLALRPTHVVMLTGRDGVPRRLRELAPAEKFELVAYPYPKTIDELGAILYNEEELVAGPGQSGSPALGVALGAGTAARRAKYRMLGHLAQIEALTTPGAPGAAGASAPKVLLVIATQPLSALGPGEVHDQLLRFVGARNATAGMTGGAPVISRERLLDLAPDVVLLLMPGDPPLEGIDRDPRLAGFRGVAIPAVERGRIALLNDPMILVPSSNLAQLAAALGKAIHPELAEALDAALAADPTTQPAEEPRPAAAAGGSAPPAGPGELSAPGPAGARRASDASRADDTPAR